MNVKICAIGIVAILALIPSTLSISAQHIKSSNNSYNIDTAIIGGDVLGLIFDIQAYVICDGVDNDFHGEVWESTTPYETGFKFNVPIPQDQDHYKVTARKNGFKSKTIDVYLTSEDLMEYKEISLYPDIKSKIPLFVFISFIRSLFNEL